MQLPRFYPILDVASARRRDLDIVSVASQILEGRATILQFRCKKFWTRAIFADLERIAELCRQAGVMLVVNDRADIARMLLASGVPLQSRDREGAVATSPFQSRDREGAVVTSSKSGSSACAVGLHLGQEDLSPGDRGRRHHRILNSQRTASSRR
jgi:thiamine monophosphate synthase